MSSIRETISYYVGRTCLGLFSWKVESDLPAAKKYVIVGAPHTSNWDFVFGLAMFFVLKINLSWMGKDALFKPPFGFMLRAIGGIAIDRNSHHGTVQQIANKFSETDQLVIGIAAKGTRKYAEYWKSGFYWIALEAKVPIVCCYLDYKNKVARIGLTIMPTGKVKQDMEKIRQFYLGIDGKRPEFRDNIRLREEDDVVTE